MQSSIVPLRTPAVQYILRLAEWCGYTPVLEEDIALANMALDLLRHRTEAALVRLWPYTAKLFDTDAVDNAAQASGLGPAWSELRGGRHGRSAA